MSENGLKRLSNQVEMLSYAERLWLLDKLLKSLYSPSKTPVKKSADFENAFGLWADRDVSLAEIRQKAWGRS